MLLNRKSDENIPGSMCEERSKVKERDNDNVGKSTRNNIGKIILHTKNNSNRKFEEGSREIK